MMVQNVGDVPCGPFPPHTPGMDPTCSSAAPLSSQPDSSTSRHYRVNNSKQSGNSIANNTTGSTNKIYLRHKTWGCSFQTSGGQKSNLTFSNNCQQNRRYALAPAKAKTSKVIAFCMSEAPRIKGTMKHASAVVCSISNSNLNNLVLDKIYKGNNISRNFNTNYLLNHSPTQCKRFNSLKLSSTLLVWICYILLLSFTSVDIAVCDEQPPQQHESNPLTSHRSGGGVSSASPCPVSEHTCDNLQCVPRDKVCNGWDDCGDNSDEHPGCTRQ